MNLVACSLAALAVALCYLFARNHRLLLERRERQMRQRVAYLLWTIAHRASEPVLLADSDLTPFRP